MGRRQAGNRVRILDLFCWAYRYELRCVFIPDDIATIVQHARTDGAVQIRFTSGDVPFETLNRMLKEEIEGNPYLMQEERFKMELEQTDSIHFVCTVRHFLRGVVQFPKPHDTASP